MVPSLTSIFTPGGEDAKSKVAYLLETNGNCSLPCWWGITPGRTSWSEAESYLATIANSTFALGSPQPNKPIKYFGAKFPDPSSNSIDDYLYASFTVNGSGIIEVIYFSAKTSIYSMLNNIGVPSQIWINLYTLLSPGQLEYTLVLFYNKGIMVEYQGTYGIDNNHFITICPKDIPKASSWLWVWNSATIQTLEDFGKVGVVPPITPGDSSRLLNEVSDMQPQSFYDIFINPAATQCIKTPWSEWFK
jgi:hypothetical protein